MSRHTQVIPFNSKGMTISKIDDFSIKIFYRGVNRKGFMNALRVLGMKAFGEYELVSDEPDELIYRMKFSCAGDTYNAMSLTSEARNLL